jgi:hypothetical protein
MGRGGVLKIGNLIPGDILVFMNQVSLVVSSRKLTKNYVKYITVVWLTTSGSDREDLVWKTLNNVDDNLAPLVWVRYADA